MRRHVATALLLASGLMTGGCGLVEEAAGEKRELGRLESLRTKTFEVKLPCIPAKDTQSQLVPGGASRPVTIHTWLCDGGDEAYLVATTVFPADVQVNLDGAAPGAADAVDGTVVSHERVTFAGAPGRDYRITATLDGEPVTSFNRVLMRQRTFYQVQVIVSEKDATQPPAQYKKILKSFSFR